MKNLSIFGLAALAAAALSFVGCELTENSSQTDTAKIAAARNALAIPAETDRDLDLPAVLHGVAISWASSDETVISSAGHVARGLYGAEATLTATLALGGASDVKEFAVTVRTIIEEAAELFELEWWEPWAWIYPTEYDNQIIMKHTGDNIMFDCTADYGLLRISLPNGATEKSASVPSGGILYWVPEGESFNRKTYGFVDVMVKSKESIIGYAVIEIFDRLGYANGWFSNFSNNDSQCATVLKSVLFPPTDGEFQNVSEAYVQAAIEKVKAEASAFYASAPKETAAKLVEVRGGALSSASSVIITMSHGDENVVFMCTVDYGVFRDYSDPKEPFSTKNMKVHSGDEVFWRSNSPGSTNWELFDYAFVEVILQLEQDIIGYVVIKVSRKHDKGIIVRSVLFPQVDGKYQNVSEAYVQTAIKKAIDSDDSLNFY